MSFMKPMIEVWWANGKITRYPETLLENSFGENAQAEIDLRFDQIETKGLYLEVKHHEPKRANSKDLDQQIDQRGIECRVYADCYVWLLSKEELRNVVALFYEGQKVLVRIGEHLINLVKLSALQQIYLPDDSIQEGAYTLIAQLYECMRSKNKYLISGENDDLQNSSEEKIRKNIAEKLGVPYETLVEAIDFYEAQEYEGPDESDEEEDRDSLTGDN